LTSNEGQNIFGLGGKSCRNRQYTVDQWREIGAGIVKGMTFA